MAEAPTAPPRPIAAEPEGANCDELYRQYVRSQTREDQLFKTMLLLVFATAVLVIIAVLMVLFGAQTAKVASGGVALVSSIGAGAVGTWFWRMHKETIVLMNAWIVACPGLVGPTLARAI